MKPPVLSVSQIEQRAEEVLAAYERQTGRLLELPVPIEKIAHRVLDLPVEWEALRPMPGREVVSKLVQPTLGVPARIVLNERLLKTTFRECPGLEQTAIGHEVGHGVFHLENGRQIQMGLGLDTGDEFTSDESHLTSKLALVLGARGPVGDDQWREWQAHTFMRFVLMPRRLLWPVLEDSNVLSWTGHGGLYSLRERCGVTISALVTHLSKLGYIEVDEGRRIHSKTPSSKGQRSLLE